MTANQDVIKRFHDALERGNLDEAASCWADDAVNHASGRASLPLMHGRGMLRRTFEALHTAFPGTTFAYSEFATA